MKKDETEEFRNTPSVVKTGDKHSIHLNMKLRWDNQENNNCRKNMGVINTYLVKWTKAVKVGQWKFGSLGEI